jgi:hypothetical protein
MVAGVAFVGMVGVVSTGSTTEEGSATGPGLVVSAGSTRGDAHQTRAAITRIAMMTGSALRMVSE